MPLSFVPDAPTKLRFVPDDPGAQEFPGWDQANPEQQAAEISRRSKAPTPGQILTGAAEAVSSGLQTGKRLLTEPSSPSQAGLTAVEAGLRGAHMDTEMVSPPVARTASALGVLSASPRPSLGQVAAAVLEANAEHGVLPFLHVLPNLARNVNPSGFTAAEASRLQSRDEAQAASAPYVEGDRGKSWLALLSGAARHPQAFARVMGGNASPQDIDVVAGSQDAMTGPLAPHVPAADVLSFFTTPSAVLGPGLEALARASKAAKLEASGARASRAMSEASEAIDEATQASGAYDRGLTKVFEQAPPRIVDDPPLIKGSSAETLAGLDQAHQRAIGTDARAQAAHRNAQAAVNDYLTQRTAQAAQPPGPGQKALQVAGAVTESALKPVESAAKVVGKGLDKLQGAADAVGLLTGGVLGTAKTHMAGRLARRAAAWAERVSTVGTALRNVASKDWRSVRNVATQIMADPNAPDWLRKAASTRAAQLFESTARTVEATAKGALHGGTVGGVIAGGASGTATPEEQAGLMAFGFGVGAAGGAAGHVISRGRYEAAREADLARKADQMLKSGMDPLTVLQTPSSVLYMAQSLENIFAGKFAGGQGVSVRIVDDHTFQSSGGGNSAVALYNPATREIFLNAQHRDDPNTYAARVAHEIGHAFMDSGLLSRPGVREQFSQAIRAASEAPSGVPPVIGVDHIKTFFDEAEKQYIDALFRGTGTPEQREQYLQQVRAEAQSKYGNPDIFILGELFSELMARSLGGKDVTLLASPSFVDRAVGLTVGDDKSVNTRSFFTGRVDALLNDPNLQAYVRDSIRAANAFRPGLDTPPNPAVKLRPQDVGKSDAATVHTYADGRRGNDFVTLDAAGNAAPAPTAKLERVRQREVLSAVQSQGAVAAPEVPETATAPQPAPAPGVPPTIPKADPTTQVRLRTRNDGSTEFSGTRLGDLRTRFSRVFSAEQMAESQTLETAMSSGQTVRAWYHAVASGESKDKWNANAARSRGNWEAQELEFTPIDWVVTQKGNLMTRVMSMTALDRVLSRLSQRHGPLSLDLWNGDIGAAKKDIAALLADHRAGRPGDTTVGPDKKNVINVILTGRGPALFADKNPLRPLVPASEREGVIRSLRLDRLEPSKPADSDMGAPRYRRWAENLSPGLSGLDASVIGDDPGLQFSPSTDPIDFASTTSSEVARHIDSVSDKTIPQVQAVKLPYPQNPVRGSVALPPRMGLVNRKLVGMPRSYAEVEQIVDRAVDRLVRVIQHDPKFAKESARFYLDMAESGMIMARISAPDLKGLGLYRQAELMLRFLALGSPRTSVDSNSAKSVQSIPAAVTGHPAGHKMGYGPQQRGAKMAFEAWQRGEAFDLSMDGVDNKVRNFYLNSLGELVDIAKRAGEEDSYHRLMFDAGAALKLAKLDEGKLSQELYPEVQRLLDGMATIDMWDMAAKGYAWPGFLLDPKKRMKADRPWQWSSEKFARENTLGTTGEGGTFTPGRAWARVLKDVGASENREVKGPEDLRYQQARALRLDGNWDWTEETWKQRLTSGQPFGPDTKFTVFLDKTEKGLSPGGEGAVYDAQQAINGLIADEINRRGLAPMFGKPRLLARNAQEILWALERLDNPLEKNNSLSLFGDYFKSLQESIDWMRSGVHGPRTEEQLSTPGERMVRSMNRSYAAMAKQNIPIEAVTSGTTPEAKAIQDKIEFLRQKGVAEPERVVTESIADGLGDEVNALAKQHGLAVTVDVVSVKEGGYSSDDGYSGRAPNIQLALRGRPEDTRQLLTALSRAMDQEAGNIFRHPTVEELHNGRELNHVLSFQFESKTPDQVWAFFQDLNALKDANGKSFLTGYTPTQDGMTIDDQYYGPGMREEVARNRNSLVRVMRKHGVPGVKSEKLVVDVFRRNDDPVNTPFTQGVAKVVRTKLDSASGDPKQFPQTRSAPRDFAADISDAEARKFRGKTEATDYFEGLSSDVDAAILRGDVSEEDGAAIKEVVKLVQERKTPASKASKSNKKR